MPSSSNSLISVPVAPKEKLHTIMEAASALTALGDEDSSSHDDHPSSFSTCSTSVVTAEEPTPTTTSKKEQTTKKQKRYLPNHKKPDAAPTFPEKVSSP